MEDDRIDVDARAKIAISRRAVAHARTIGLESKGFLLPGAPIHRPVMLSELSIMRKYPIGEKDQVHGLPTSIRYNQSIKSDEVCGLTDFLRPRIFLLSVVI